MKRVSHGHGFLISMLFNMAFRIEWVVIAIILFILSKFLPIPVWCGFIALGIWVAISLIVTLTLSLANSLGNVKDPVRENKNPYSVKTVPTINKGTDIKGGAGDDKMCPCCGKYKFDEAGKYEVCPICGWEDDPVQRENPSFAGGANHLSLNEAKINYEADREKADV